MTDPRTSGDHVGLVTIKRDGSVVVDSASKILSNGVPLTDMRDLWAAMCLYPGHKLPPNVIAAHAAKLHRTMGATKHFSTVLRAMYRDPISARKSYPGWIQGVSKRDEDYIFDRQPEPLEAPLAASKIAPDSDSDSDSVSDAGDLSSASDVLLDIRLLLVYQSRILQQAWAPDMDPFFVWKAKLQRAVGSEESSEGGE